MHALAQSPGSHGVWSQPRFRKRRHGRCRGIPSMVSLPGIESPTLVFACCGELRPNGVRSAGQGGEAGHEALRAGIRPRRHQSLRCKSEARFAHIEALPRAPTPSSLLIHVLSWLSDLVARAGRNPAGTIPRHWVGRLAFSCGVHYPQARPKRLPHFLHRRRGR
jgi:hypothetical protein